MSFDQAAAIVKNGGLPTCGKCGAVLKPAITFFGEALPQDVFAAAEREAAQASLLLALGSSLTVYPAAGIPEYTLRNGGSLVIVNNQPTSYDDAAVMRFQDLDQVFGELNALCQ
jgi:NAD-dependent deacetylase